MFTALLSFFKGKIFSQAGSFLLPVIGLIAVFLIWNSDVILTKFGYETRSNLKAEVVRLNGEVQKLKDANVSLSNAINKTKEDTSVTVEVIEGVFEAKTVTKTTVNSIVDERKRKAQELLNTCNCATTEKVTAEKKETVKPITADQTKPKLIQQPRLDKPKEPVSQEIVDRLSEDNIDAIHIAYSSFFPETQP